MTLTQIDGWHLFQTYQRIGREGRKAETVKSLSPLSDWIQLNSVLEREKYGREIALLICSLHRTEYPSYLSSNWEQNGCEVVKAVLKVRVND